MPNRVTVRPAKVNDAAGISGVYTGTDLPCTEPAEWAVHTNHRLLHGFLIDVALMGKRIVGHAEWIVSDEPAPYGKHLYLGMLEVHPDFRGRGVGRALVEAGMRQARDLSCPVVKTMSEKDARGFYRKCGLVHTARVAVGSEKLRPVALPKGWVRGRTVPYSVVKALPMRLGWAQACSAHMWSVCNRPTRLAGEEPDRHPCAKTNNGAAYVQLRYCPQAGRSALAIAWAPNTVSLATLCRVATALADGLPVQAINFMVPAEDRAVLARACHARPTASDDTVWARQVT